MQDPKQSRDDSRYSEWSKARRLVSRIFRQRSTNKDMVPRNRPRTVPLIPISIKIKYFFSWRQVHDESQSLYELGLHERGEILCEFQVSPGAAYLVRFRLI